MNLEIDSTLLDQLDAIAKTQKRNVNAVLLDAIRLYIRLYDDHADFRALVQTTINEHRALLDLLADN